MPEGVLSLALFINVIIRYPMDQIEVLPVCPASEVLVVVRASHCINMQLHFLFLKYAKLNL